MAQLASNECMPAAGAEDSVKLPIPETDGDRDVDSDDAGETIELTPEEAERAALEKQFDDLMEEHPYRSPAAGDCCVSPLFGYQLLDIGADVENADVAATQEHLYTYDDEEAWAYTDDGEEKLAEEQVDELADDQLIYDDDMPDKEDEHDEKSGDNEHGASEEKSDVQLANSECKAAEEQQEILAEDRNNIQINCDQGVADKGSTTPCKDDKDVILERPFSGPERQMQLENNVCQLEGQKQTGGKKRLPPWLSPLASRRVPCRNLKHSNKVCESTEAACTSECEVQPEAVADSSDSTVVPTRRSPLDGEWRDDSGVVGVVVGQTLSWTHPIDEDSHTTQLGWEEDLDDHASVWMDVLGERICGVLVEGELRWSTGDVWLRATPIPSEVSGNETDVAPSGNEGDNAPSAMNSIARAWLDASCGEDAESGAGAPLLDDRGVDELRQGVFESTLQRVPPDVAPPPPSQAPPPPSQAPPPPMHPALKEESNPLEQTPPPDFSFSPYDREWSSPLKEAPPPPTEKPPSQLAERPVAESLCRRQLPQERPPRRPSPQAWKVPCRRQPLQEQPPLQEWQVPCRRQPPREQPPRRPASQEISCVSATMRSPVRPMARELRPPVPGHAPPKPPGHAVSKPPWPVQQLPVSPMPVSPLVSNGPWSSWSMWRSPYADGRDPLRRKGKRLPMPQDCSEAPTFSTTAGLGCFGGSWQQWSSPGPEIADIWRQSNDKSLLVPKQSGEQRVLRPLHELEADFARSRWR